MQRSDVQELHSIQRLENLVSIMQHGILSHRRAQRIPHISVANEEVQALRAQKVVAGGRPLHEYACLYFNARNMMMYSMHEQHAGLCVVRVSDELLDLNDVVVTDQNASRWGARFREPQEGLAALDRDLVFAEWWTDPDPAEKDRLGAITCAEVLVPDVVPLKSIEGFDVSCEEARIRVESMGLGIPATVNAYLFFRGPR